MSLIVIDKNQDWSKYKPAYPFPLVKGWVRNWFSNFAESPITINNITYSSVENYYQAMKSMDINDHKAIAAMSPSKSKMSGRRLALRPDWEDVKQDVMTDALIQKFLIPEWRDKLLLTGDETLIEWNNWNDKIWGVSIKDCKGANLLGQILMQIRTELAKDFHINKIN